MPRTWTAEQRLAASEKFKARMAARKAQATAVADPEPQVEAATASEEAAVGEDVMHQLASLFAKASTEKKGREKAINDALDILGRLDPAKYPDVADNPAVEAFVEKVQAARAQSADMPPGTVIGRGIAAQKVPWSWAHLKKSMNLSPEEFAERSKTEPILFPWVEYMPIKTTTVVWNGLRVYFKARQRVYVCKVFVDAFEESLNQEEFAAQHAAWLFHSPGAATHRDMLTSGAAKVRAMDESKGEYYHPGGGMIGLAPSSDLVGLGGEGESDE